MASTKKPPQPPYMNIDPSLAAQQLSDPIDTTRFANAAAFAGKGREDLAAAAVFHVGGLPLPDPCRPGPFSAGSEGQP